jgi:Cdc6-like AAA superfamily ATPase
MSWIDRLTARFRRRAPDHRQTMAALAGPRPAPAIRAEAARVEKAKRLAGPSFPRFQSTAGDQLDPRISDRFAGVRVRLRSAYTPSQPVTDRRMFAGRTKTLSSLIRAIEDQRLHTVIYGERGIGKTSLLHVLSQAAREARYQVVYVSCGAGSNFDETFRAVAHGIPLLFHRAYGPTSPEAERGETLGDLLPEEPITVRSATDMLQQVDGTRVLLILDEFDRCESAEFRRTIAELLKSLSDRSMRVQLVIAGVAANLTELLEHVPSIQRNLFALQVPKMSAQEVRHLVKNGEAASGLTFDEGAIQAIISRAIGSPYLASLLSHRAGLLAVDEARLTVTSEDVGAATVEAVGELKNRITRRSQIQIDQCVRSGMLGTLGAVGGVAQSTGGPFTQEDIGGLRGEAESISKAKALIEQLASAGALIEAREDEFGRNYRFMEDSVPVYLWLLSSQHRQGGAQEPASAAAAT